MKSSLRFALRGTTRIRLVTFSCAAGAVTGAFFKVTTRHREESTARDKGSMGSYMLCQVYWMIRCSLVRWPVLLPFRSRPPQNFDGRPLVDGITVDGLLAALSFGPSRVRLRTWRTVHPRLGCRTLCNCFRCEGVDHPLAAFCTLLRSLPQGGPCCFVPSIVNVLVRCALPSAAGGEMPRLQRSGVLHRAIALVMVPLSCGYHAK